MFSLVLASFGLCFLLHISWKGIKGTELLIVIVASYFIGCFTVMARLFG